ncbi:MAG TPA: cytochrome c oxidase subunit 3 family protein [Tepidisphaeraceae bacterium]
MNPYTAHLQHHFRDLEQQREASTLGMWTFLATEVLFFGGLFLGYSVYRVGYPDAWTEGSHHLKEWAGAINTGVLLCSSLTMALAVRCAALRMTRQTTWFLLGTIALGFVFLGIKAIEYTLEWREGLVPHFKFDMNRYAANPALGNRVQLFMSFYFIMTALHATHMIVGIGLVSWVAYHAWKGRYTDNPTWVEMTGLYWHFVDIVWIFLFPLLYLIR